MQGLLWMTASTASFSAMIIAVRYLSDTIPPFEQVFLRSVISLAIGLPMVLRVWREATHTVKPDALGRLYATRALGTFIGVSAWFFAVAVLPLAEADAHVLHDFPVERLLVENLRFVVRRVLGETEDGIRNVGAPVIALDHNPVAQGAEGALDLAVRVRREGVGRVG